MSTKCTLVRRNARRLREKRKHIALQKTPPNIPSNPPNIPSTSPNIPSISPTPPTLSSTPPTSSIIPSNPPNIPSNPPNLSSVSPTLPTPPSTSPTIPSTPSIVSSNPPSFPSSSKMPPDLSSTSEIPPNSSPFSPNITSTSKMPPDLPFTSPVPPTLSSNPPNITSTPPTSPNSSSIYQFPPSTPQIPPNSPSTSKMPPNVPSTLPNLSSVPPTPPSSSPDTPTLPSFPPNSPSTSKMPPSFPSTSKTPPSLPSTPQSFPSTSITPPNFSSTPPIFPSTSKTPPSISSTPPISLNLPSTSQIPSSIPPTFPSTSKTPPDFSSVSPVPPTPLSGPSTSFGGGENLEGDLGAKPPHLENIHEMLHVAREVRPGDAAAHLLTFSEFCLFTTELRQCYDKETPRPPLLSKLPDKSCSEKKRSERKMSTESSPKYEVFLGGSCNPTTWRQKVAIPMLKDHGISYYNPQVAHWEEALVEVEYQAKQTASVLFFVLDRNTRNVASMVESAYLAGRRRKLVIVIDSYTGPGQLINGEAISEQEYQDLTNGLNTVQDLVERQGIPVFAEINHALNCTAKILRDNIHPQDLGTEDQVQPIKYPYLQLGDKLLKLHDAFVNSNSEQITLADARVAYKVVTGKELSTEELQTIIALKKGIDIQEVNGTELPLNDITLTFDEFCCIVAEFKNHHLESKRLWDILSHSLQKVIGWALPRRPLRPVSSSGGRDIYLGGSLGSRITWREDIAIPLLRKHALKFFNPAAGTCSGRLLPTEAILIEHSKVLLFVITNNTRGVSAMAKASHYIGLGCCVVLCIQMLTEDSLVSGEQLSRHALKDYNRGRSYLADQANKDGVPVFSDIEEALECAISKVHSR